MKQCQKRSIRTSLDPSESHCQIEQVYFWSIDGQDELRELETYSDAPMPLIDIAGVYIISDKRQKQLRSSVSDLSLSDLSWSSFHFCSLYSQFIVLVCLFILYDLFSYLFSSCFARQLQACVCVSVCVCFCAPPPPASGWKCSRDFSPLSRSQ